MRWEKRDVEAGSEAEDKAGCGEMDSSRAVGLRLDNCGILIDEGEYLSLYAAC